MAALAAIWRHRTPILIAIVVLLITLQVRQHNERIRVRAIASERARADSVLLGSLQGRLAETTRRLVQAEGATVRAVAAYDSARATIILRPVPRPQPAIGPSAGPAGPLPPAAVDTEYVVSPAFIAATDRLRLECSVLRTDCATARIQADSTINAQARIIEALRQREAAGAGGKTPYLLIGAVALGSYILGLKGWP